MTRKRRILYLSILTLLLIGLSSLLIRLTSHEKDGYEWKTYKYEELISLFQDQKPIFYKVAKLVATNEKFWDQARESENSGHADIMSPNDNKIMALFTQSEQDTLRDFFSKTRPYEISLKNKQYITITYTNEDKTDSFNLTYYYDKTAVNIYGRTDYSDWLSWAKHNYKNFADLGGEWFLYGGKQ